MHISPKYIIMIAQETVRQIHLLFVFRNHLLPNQLRNEPSQTAVSTFSISSFFQISVYPMFNKMAIDAAW